MITRIRLEAVSDTKPHVISELEEAARRVLNAIGSAPWELTDDVVVPDRGTLGNEIKGYKGRHVYHFRGVQ